MASGGPHQEPYLAESAMEVGGVGVAPVTGALAGEGRDSWRVNNSETPPSQPVPPTNQDASVPDLLDDEAIMTSQALVPIDSESTIQMSQALVPLGDNQLATTAPAPAAAEQAQETPEIAGIGRIKHNKGPRKAPQKRERITVPEKSINGGLEFKFEPDPRNVDLCDIMTAEEYTDAITALNETLRPSRSKSVDTGLLITGPLILPLAVWGVRHSKQVKKRKLLLVQGIDGFNDSHPTLYMRYNRPGTSSFLTIERRKEEHKTISDAVEESWMDREPVV